MDQGSYQIQRQRSHSRSSQMERSQGHQERSRQGSHSSQGSHQNQRQRSRSCSSQRDQSHDHSQRHLARSCQGSHSSQDGEGTDDSITFIPPKDKPKKVEPATIQNKSHQLVDENGLIFQKENNNSSPATREIQPQAPVSALKCNFCEKNFSTVGNQNKHIRTIHKRCHICDLGFPTSKSLLEHMLAQHSQKQRAVPNSLKCPKCQLTVKNKKALSNHLAIHKDKKYICTQCGSRFARKDYLSNHELIHSGEKSFSCKSCDRQFKQKSTLYKHTKICNNS